MLPQAWREKNKQNYIFHKHNEPYIHIHVCVYMYISACTTVANNYTAIDWMQTKKSGKTACQTGKYLLLK